MGKMTGTPLPGRAGLELLYPSGAEGGHSSSEERTIRITDLSGHGDQTVGGVLIEAGGLRVLVDPGGLPGRVPASSPAVTSPLPLHAVVVSHAHADHSAGLTAVISEHPATPVIATPSTLALLNVLGRFAGTSPYVRPVPFREDFSLEATLDVQPWMMRLLPAGHLLGAAMIEFETPEGHLVYTGDVNTSPQHTVQRSARRVSGADQRVDILVMESTYGERDYRPRIHEEARLIGQVHDALDRGGHALIAAPALGTAQEILLILLEARLHHRVTGAIWVDAAIGAIDTVYDQYASLEYPRLARWIAMHGNPFRPDSGLVSVARPEDYSAILENSPAMVLTDLSNFRGGDGQVFARELACDTRHLILVPAGRATRGYVARTVSPADIRCAVGSYGLMTHADGAALTAMAVRWRAQLVVLSHGQANSRSALQARLTEGGINGVVSVGGQTICWPPTATGGDGGESNAPSKSTQ